MATKLGRVFQAIFGSAGPVSQFEEFGSDAAGATVKTQNIASIMSTAAWPQGWYAATESANQPPRIEDFNAIDLLITTQLAYIFQEGIAEYDPTTVYFVGSFCQVAGVVYVSQSNSNAGNNPTTDSGANWLQALGGVIPGAGWIPQLTAAFGAFVAPNASKLGGVTPGAGWLTALAAAANSGAANGIDAKTLATITPGALGLALLALSGNLAAGWANGFASAAWGGIVGAAPGSGWAGSLAAPTTSFTPPPPIGFVYFQGPNDASPASLWPAGTWTDVSWEEANLVRRTYGSLAGSLFGGVPARLTVSVSGGVPAITITSGGSGYLSGGSGTVPLIISGSCSTQMVATATVTNGVITAINVSTAGAGYTAGALAIYDGVVGHGDLSQNHIHQSSVLISSNNDWHAGFTGTGNPDQGYYTLNSGTEVSDGAHGAPRVGAENAGAWTAVTKWRKTA
ncbi:MAG: hypothetical protein ACLQMF_20280 [Rectinemataceae bacterium]